MASKKKEPDFEQSLAELESLVEQMEEGELSLEDSIKTYERGVLLGRSALKALDEAEQRVKVLAAADDHAEPAEGADAGDESGHD